MTQTYGERIVRASLNPSDSSLVDKLKADHAGIITLLADMRAHAGPEAARCYSLAVTHLETACMYAVKGATMPQPDVLVAE